jgi:hypothetical protein
MSKEEKNKIMLAEHVLEVRHDASGTFLDTRGFVADFIRANDFLPHWKIDSNVVNFRDESERIRQEGAFVGYKSAGFVGLNSPTRNFFPERGSAFWKLLVNNGRYKLPPLLRFGTRTKIFMPSIRTFEEINKLMYEGLFTENARNLIGEKETDLQFVIDFKESEFDVRVVGGPIHKDEGRKDFQFESDSF